MKAGQQLLLDWYRDMIECYEQLPEETRAELDRWEKENLPKGILGTSDWPGWQKYLPKRPGSVLTLVPKRRQA